tara:strand:- start:1250 stop:1489 length:240 start_codon:yes stop_codon:yes gene_type:complete
MYFKQKKDGSCTLNFSEEEIEIIKNKKSIHFTAEGLRHFGNVLMAMVIEFNNNFTDEVKNLKTDEETTVTGVDKDDYKS